MNTSKKFRVAVFADLTEREWQVLASLTRLSTARPRCYVFEPPSSATPDIYLVDEDSSEMQRLWRSARKQHLAPPIFLKEHVDLSAERREFKRPLIPSCLLSLANLLDEVTVQELRFLPELCIGQETPPPHASGAVKAGRSARFSALVVDDSSTVRTQVELGLKMFGVYADLAETAEEAFELLVANAYDIAFLDVVLPGGADGYQICKTIKKDPAMRHTTVVMLTGKSSTFDRVKASLAGCDTFLAKPVQNDVFQKVLSKYLKEDEAMGAGHSVPAK